MSGVERAEIGPIAERTLNAPAGAVGHDAARVVTTPAPTRGLGTFDALRVRDYRLLWTGSLISNIGTWMQMIGQGWLVLSLTNSPFWLGMVSFASAIPSLLISLPAGVLADRVDRRRLLLVTQSTAGALALLLAVLTSTGVVQVWQIMLIAFCSSLTFAVDNPARQAMVPDMVGRDRLMNAVGLNSAAWNGASVLGPSIAGVAIGIVGVAGCFYLNAASFLGTILAVWLMRTRSVGTGTGHSGLLDSLAELRRYVRRDHLTLALLAMVAIPTLFGRPYQQLMPVFAREILGGGPRLYGILMSANGIGALIGALCTASFGRLGHKGRILIASTVIFGLNLVVFALAQPLALILPALVLAGSCATLYMGSVNTLLQTSVPAELRGRILSVYSLIMGGLMPLGGMLFGSAASLTGSAPLVVATGGTLVALGVIAVALAEPRLRTTM
jgi:MFS family permease